MILRNSLAAAALTLLGTACAASGHPRLAPPPVSYRDPPANAITFWGHACAYIDIDGFGIVTDPVFANRTFIRRRKIPAPPPEVYDQTRIILISHAHHDHLNAETLRRFPSNAEILAPAPSAKYLMGHGIRARVMKPGDEYPFPGGTITAVAAHHPGGRYSMNASADGRALGYVVQTASSTIYYSGDTDYFPGFAAIGSRYRPDVAILNLNPHLLPPEAILAAADLGMPRVVPIHTGAFKGTCDRLGPGWRNAMVEALGPSVVPLGVGESMSLDHMGSVARVPETRVRERLTSGAGWPVAVRDPDARGIPNFAEIGPGLSRGGHPTDEGIAYLRSRGYRTVVGFARDPEERAKLDRAGIAYVEIPLRADLLGARPPTDAQVREFLSIAMDSTQRPLFFHCKHGKDRTGAMAAIYRVEACGWSTEDAIEEMKALGFHGYYRRLMRFVRAYAAEGSAAPGTTPAASAAAGSATGP